MTEISFKDTYNNEVENLSFEIKGLQKPSTKNVQILSQLSFN